MKDGVLQCFFASDSEMEVTAGLEGEEEKAEGTIKCFRKSSPDVDM
jgi:hypothetical protein